MTKDTDSNTRETTQPAYYAYSVSEPKRRGQKGRWTRIGAYFAHEDAKSRPTLTPFVSPGKLLICLEKA